MAEAEKNADTDAEAVNETVAETMTENVFFLKIDEFHAEGDLLWLALESYSYQPAENIL